MHFIFGCLIVCDSTEKTGGGRVAKWRESDSILVPKWQTHHSRCQGTCTDC